MRKIHITFGGYAYDETTGITVRDGPKLGADEVWVYDDKWLMSHPFYRLNHWLWETEIKGEKVDMGFGWCAWKPLIIVDALARLEKHDVVLYTDGDVFPIRPYGNLFELCGKAGGIFLFEEQGCVNKDWIKQDCFFSMGIGDDVAVNAQHACGRFQLFQKGPWLPQQILMEWLAYSQNPRCNTWLSSELENRAEFIRHGNEQAILSLLASEYAIPLHRTPDQNGSLPKDPEYPQVFHQEPCQGDRGDTRGSRFRNV